MLISEFQPNPAETDPANQIIELSGTPGELFQGVLISIDSDGGGGLGVVDRAAAVSGTFDADGLLTVSVADLENPSFTLALLDSFTGTAGTTDLDTDDDGTADETSTLGTVFDAIGVPDSDSDEAFLYGSQLGGSDFAFTGDEPRLVFRDASVGALYAVNDPDNGQVFNINGTDVGTAIFGVDPTVGADTFGAVNPTAGTSGESTPIYEIQGAGHVSPLVEQPVTTSGIVTAVDSIGFYLQDPAGDGDIATSDAIFVFTGSGGATGISVGDELEVTGNVAEFTPGGASTRNLSTTQLNSIDTTTLSTGNVLPDAVILGAGGRIPPSNDIDDDAFASFDPETDGIDFFESLEAMRVTAQNAVAIAPTNQFGEIFTVVDGGSSASGISDRGTLNISPDDFNPERVQIDEDSDIFDFEFPDVAVGDRLGDVTGVVSYSFGNFEILPTVDFTSTIQPAGLQPEISPLVGEEERLSIATYNVLNLDPIVEDVANVEDNDEGDIDDDEGDGRFAAIAQQIVSNLNAPDIIGLQEIQDNTGAEIDDGVTSASETLQKLVDAIVAAGGPEYDFIDNTFITEGASGGQPGGNIRPAFLYNDNRVDLVEGSVQPVGNQDPGSPFFGARLPLVATFTFQDEEITIVNNHFSSKGGSAPILGVDQPFEDRQEDPTVNGSLDERREQAQAVNNFVDGILAENDDANIAVLGDLNEFEFVSPLEILAGTIVSTEEGQDIIATNESAILTNLINDVPENERYSFIFQGNSQELDHILVSNGLLSGAEIDIVNINSEFAATPDRASDHDPVLAVLNFGADQGFLGFEQAVEIATAQGFSIPYTPVELGGLNLGEFFDNGLYLSQNPDVAQAIANGAFSTGFDHFVQFGLAEGRNGSILFDEAEYLAANFDVQEAVNAGTFGSGLQHFVLFGHLEGRDPGSVFSQQNYLTENPDVSDAVAAGLIGSAFEHYVESGALEGRLPELSLYQEDFYLAQNTDVVDAVGTGAFDSGFDHFAQFGVAEGRDPSELFSNNAYLAANPDVAQAVASGLIPSGFFHYALFGSAEGRAIA